MQSKAKILVSLMVISLVGYSGYRASLALFSDTETNTESSFQAGTLDLDVDSNNQGFDSFQVSNIGTDGTVSGGKTWTITNVGSLPGILTFSVDTLVNRENGCNEPESKADTTCDSPGDGQGELGNALSTTVRVNGSQVVASNLATANQGQYASQWDSAGQVIIPAGQSVEVNMNWETNPSQYGNEIQSDGLSFDIGFLLTQVQPQ